MVMIICISVIVCITIISAAICFIIKNNNDVKLNKQDSIYTLNYVYYVLTTIKLNYLIDDNKQKIIDCLKHINPDYDENIDKITEEN